MKKHFIYSLLISSVSLYIMYWVFIFIVMFFFNRQSSVMVEIYAIVMLLTIGMMSAVLQSILFSKYFKLHMTRLLKMSIAMLLVYFIVSGTYTYFKSNYDRRQNLEMQEEYQEFLSRLYKVSRIKIEKDDNVHIIYSFTGLKSGRYELRTVIYDFIYDEPIYSRNITLNSPSSYDLSIPYDDLAYRYYMSSRLVGEDIYVDNDFEMTTELEYLGNEYPDRRFVFTNESKLHMEFSVRGGKIFRRD